MRYRISLIGVLLLSLSHTTLYADYPFIVKKAQTETKQIALTFDDGPEALHTEYILQILASENVKATFFLLGKNIEKHPQLAKKIVEAGHDVGNHSYSHRNFYYLNQIEITEEIKESQYQFYSVFGTFPIYFRPPYGNLNRRDMPLVRQYFHRIIKWSIDTNDWRKSASPSAIKKLILNKVHPGSIILFHEKHIKSLGNLPEIIKALKKEGYSFVTISEFLNDDLPEKSIKNGMIDTH